jgi:hypothetical protein
LSDSEDGPYFVSQTQFSNQALRTGLLNDWIKPVTIAMATSAKLSQATGLSARTRVAFQKHHDPYHLESGYTGNRKAR